MVFQELLSMIAGALVVVAVIPYIRAIVRGKTKPSKASWVVWTLLSTITAAGMFQAGTINYQIPIVALGDSAILVLAFKYGTPGWRPVERWSLVAGMASIALWVATQDPLWAIVISLSTNFVGALPTFTKLWSEPGSEDPTAWSIVTVSAILQTIAVSEWTVAAAMQPVSFLTIQGTILFLIFIRPRRFLVRA